MPANNIVRIHRMFENPDFNIMILFRVMLPTSWSLAIFVGEEDTKCIQFQTPNIHFTINKISILKYTINDRASGQVSTFFEAKILFRHAEQVPNVLHQLQRHRLQNIEINGSILICTSLEEFFRICEILDTPDLMLSEISEVVRDELSSELPPVVPVQLSVPGISAPVAIPTPSRRSEEASLRRSEESARRSEESIPISARRSAEAVDISIFAGCIKIFCDIASNCTICLSPLNQGSQNMATPCGHIFHDNCLAGAIAHRRGCPLCRDQRVGANR